MNSKINNETNNETKDLCKTCTHYWQDFPLPLDHIESHCEILDEKKGLKNETTIKRYSNMYRNRFALFLLIILLY